MIPGCAHEAALQTYEVVEKNKVARPSWLEVPEGVIREGDGYLDYLFHSTRSGALPNAFSFAEAEAREGLRSSLGAFLLKDFERITEEKKMHPSVHEELTPIIDSQIDRLSKSEMSVFDVYYEKYIRPASAGGQKASEEVYDFYFWLRIGQGPFQDLRAGIAQSLRGSKDNRLELLGKIFHPAPSPLFGH